MLCCRNNQHWERTDLELSFVKGLLFEEERSSCELLSCLKQTIGVPSGDTLDLLNPHKEVPRFDSLKQNGWILFAFCFVDSLHHWYRGSNINQVFCKGEEVKLKQWRLLASCLTGHTLREISTSNVHSLRRGVPLRPQMSLLQRAAFMDRGSNLQSQQQHPLRGRPHPGCEVKETSYVYLRREIIQWTMLKSPMSKKHWNDAQVPETTNRGLFSKIDCPKVRAILQNLN